MIVDVVDVGANPIDGIAPYQRLLDDGLARVVGFEPNLDALAKCLTEKELSDFGKLWFDGCVE